ncbi:hypothetical protein BJV82DRAFT_668698 [Fennellomyces sp. T-0311]|nr:hypothetical protein BJV82DRAFT_668698 [Fennellomyces sp. T-0311]
MAHRPYPETMYALQMVKHGSPEGALKYVQLETPSIKSPTDVIVNVKAVGVNIAESKLRSGNIFPLELPCILGSDFAGVIVAKGSMVMDLNVGDPVFGLLSDFSNKPKGSYAEYITVSTEKDFITTKPDNVSFEEAASVGVASLTAYYGIYFNLPESGPKKVIVVGASGGVGAFAIQIAKALGAHVIGICSGKNVAYVSNLGADRVVDYTSRESMAKLESEKESYDLVMDCVGGDDYYYRLVPLLKPKGVFATAVGPVKHLFEKKATRWTWIYIYAKVLMHMAFSSRKYMVIRGIRSSDWVKDIRRWLEDGTIKSLVDESQILPLKDGAKAHILLDSQRTVGKICLRV